MKSNADFVRHLKEVAPELVEEFDADYDEVVIGNFDVCTRCGLVVGARSYQDHHNWHYSLSLTIYALGSVAKHLLGEDGD